jgi:hypothetical protein
LAAHFGQEEEQEDKKQDAKTDDSPKIYDIHVTRIEKLPHTGAERLHRGPSEVRGEVSIEGSQG